MSRKTYAIRNNKGILLPWTASSLKEESIRKFTDLRGERWQKLNLDDGYEVVEVKITEADKPTV